MATTRTGAWLVALVFAAGACSSDGGGSPGPTVGELPPPISESVFLESADGVVSLEVPAGTVREGTDLGIDVVDPAELRDELVAFGDTTLVGSVYRLRPEGLVFPEPLIVTVRAGDIAEPGVVPLVFAALSVDGTPIGVTEARTEVDVDGSFVHRAPVDRFGIMVLVDGGVRFELDPNDVADLAPGDEFDATLTAQAVEGFADPGGDVTVRWDATGATSERSPQEPVNAALSAEDLAGGWQLVNTFVCETIGAGDHGVELRVDITDRPPGTTTVQFLTLAGRSTCGDVGR